MEGAKNKLPPSIKNKSRKDHILFNFLRNLEYGEFGKKSQKSLFPAVIVVGSLFLYLTTFYNYILFHSMLELFTVVISFGIFVLAWTARRYINNNFLLLIGIGYCFVGMFDLVHMLSYEGLDVFRRFDLSNLSSQLWVASRYFESATFVAAFLFFKEKFYKNFNETRKKSNIIFLTYSIFFLILFFSIFWWQIFPTTYQEDLGLTQFKKNSEYVISFLFLLSIGLLYRKKDKFDHEMVSLLSLAFLMKIASEIAFTKYVGVYDFANMFGHLLKFISFLLVYRAVLEIGLMRPYRFLFLSLQKSQEKYLSTQMELRKKTEKRLQESYGYMGLINRKISIILELEKNSQNYKNRQELVNYILRLAIALSRAKIGLIYRYVKGGRFNLISQRGLNKDIIKNFQVIGFDCADFLSKMMEEKIRINGSSEIINPGCFGAGNNLNYFVVLPLIKDNECQGFIFLGFSGMESMDSQELEFLDIFSIHVSSAFINAKIF